MDIVCSEFGNVFSQLEMFFAVGNVLLTAWKSFILRMEMFYSEVNFIFS